MTDYTDLIARLRTLHLHDDFSDWDTLTQAAAAIAALTAERDALRGALDDAVHMLRRVLADDDDAELTIRDGVFHGSKRQFYSTPAALTPPPLGAGGPLFVSNEDGTISIIGTSLRSKETDG